MLESTGWIAAHRFLFAGVRCHLLGWPPRSGSRRPPRRILLRRSARLSLPTHHLHGTAQAFRRKLPSRRKNNSMDDKAEKVALFRYGLIAPLVLETLPRGELTRRAQQIAARLYDIPHSTRRQVSVDTLLDWTLQNNRERSFCCGGGSGGPWKDRVGKESLGEIRITEALGTGASVIATACPYCIRTLNEAIAKLGVGNKIKVQDIAELLLQSVDLSDKTAITGTNHINMTVSQEDAHV